MKNTVYVIIPNLNGAHNLPKAIDSVLAQSYKNLQLIIVDNGSHDNSRQVIESYLKKDSRVRAVWLDKNYGYTGGVNPGFELAIKENAGYAAPFNNDAVADKDWLKHLAAFLDAHPKYGIATCTLLHANGNTIDSTGDLYTVWGIPFPRGRDEPDSERYNEATEIFGASGGASMYRVNMLRNIGIFDQDFFAYYEDIDSSFRAQLAGWKVAFVPKSIVYHMQGQTSSRLGKRTGDGRTANSFTTQQFMRNLPIIVIKDVPRSYLKHIVPRLALAYSIFFVKAALTGRGVGAIKGFAQALSLTPKKLRARKHIQQNRKVPDSYIWSIITHDLPPNARKLRSLRSMWWRFTGKKDRISGQ